MSVDSKEVNSADELDSWISVKQLRETVFAYPADRRSFLATLDAFRQYRKTASLQVYVRRQSFYALPMSQLELFSQPPFSIPETFSRIDDAIAINADLAESIANHVMRKWGPLIAEDAIITERDEADLPLHDKLSVYFENTVRKDCNRELLGTATNDDISRAQSALYHLYRDWSAEGSIERLPIYRMIFKGLRQAHKGHYEIGADGEPIRTKVLVPGAGQGRLVYELSQAGFIAEGNELSYSQLLVSEFIMNGTTQAQQFALYPWAVSFSNHHSREHQLQNVMLPDILPQPSSFCPGERKLTVGDFCVVYKQPKYKDHFDSVITMFFIDTAPNLVEYIETVKHCLRPRGSWINIGPLQWHSGPKKSMESTEKNRMYGTKPRADDDHGGPAGVGTAGRVELTQEEVMLLIKEYGFEEVELKDDDAQPCAPQTYLIHNSLVRKPLQVGYMQNPESMFQAKYRPVHWMALKR